MIAPTIPAAILAADLQTYSHARHYAMRQTHNDESLSHLYATFYMEEYPGGEGDHSRVFWRWLELGKGQYHE